MQHPRPRRPTAPLVLSVLALVAALGGVAYSAIPDPMGVIHGCYTNSPGRTLRVIDSTESCPGGETALNWNQQGPTGPAGPTGVQGPEGPQGPPGQPPAFTKSVIKATVPDNIGFVEVARLNVPAGRYVVIAKAVALVAGSKTLGVTAAGCLLRVGAAGLNGQLAAEQASDLASATLVTGNGLGSATATLVTTVANEFAPRGTLAKPGAISLRCQPGVIPSNDVTFTQIHVTAIRVAELPELLTFKVIPPKPAKRKVTVVRKKA
jgi:hypothetical protein